jgi:hypothetical protein
MILPAVIMHHVHTCALCVVLEICSRHLERQPYCHLSLLHQTEHWNPSGKKSLCD